LRRLKLAERGFHWTLLTPFGMSHRSFIFIALLAALLWGGPLQFFPKEPH
jgi:hypothetical protein